MHSVLEISQFIAQAFVTGLWQGLVLISAVAILLRFIPRLSATVRFAVWGFVFALAAAMPLLHFPTVGVLRPHMASAMVQLGAGWGLAITAIWVVLMLVRGAQLLKHTLRLRRIWRQARPLPMEYPVVALLQKSGRRAVELCTSNDVDSPSVIGFFSPRLLIPEWLFAKLAPSDLQQIVLHECEHLRRRDDWINLLQKVALVIFPLNPALLWVDRRLSLERELACDAGVVSSTTAPFEYAHCLTRLAEHRLQRRSVALSLSAWSRQSELARRVHQLLRPAHKRNLSRLQARLAMALICVALGAGAVQMARAPRLFSFADAAPSTPMAESSIPKPNTVTTHALPVNFRQEAQPRPVLVNAVLPSPKPRRSLHKSVQGSQLRKAVHTPRQDKQPRLILTTFEMGNPGNDSKILPLYAQPIQVSPSYAAVPFGNGWLVIQL